LGKEVNFNKKIGCQFPTVIHLLFCRIQAGVRSAAVQLTKARKATVIAVTSAEKKSSLVEAGADGILFRGESHIKQLGNNAVDLVGTSLCLTGLPGGF